MPSFTFTGDQPYVYTSVQLADGSTLEAVPGQSYDLDAAPDDLFVPVASAPLVAPPEPSVLVTDPAPVSSPTDPSPTAPAA